MSLQALWTLTRWGAINSVVVVVVQNNKIIALAKYITEAMKVRRNKVENI